MSTVLRARQKLGKYRIERRLAEGAFANVYQALDTIEGVRVALKVPHAHLVTQEVLEELGYSSQDLEKLRQEKVI